MNKNEKNNSSFSEKNFPILKNGIELLFMVLIAVIVLVSVLTVFNIYLGTGTPVAVTTTSMAPVYGGFKPDLLFDEPELRKYYLPLDGDLLVLKKQTPHLGDTIVFKKNSAHTPTPIVHRIIAIQTNSSGFAYYLTKGDNNFGTDYKRFGWISEDELIGVVIGKIPSIGWLSLEIQNITMRIFLIIGLGVLLLLMLFEEEDKKTKEKGNHYKKSSSGIFLKFFNKLKPKYSGLNYNKSRWIVKMFSTPKGNIFTVALIITTIFLSLNIQKAFVLNNGVNITSSNTLELINAGPENIGTGFYFIHFDLEIISRGIFNWVYKIELRLNSSDNDVVYIWIIPYSFDGKLIIKSGFPISQEIITSTGNYSINLYYTIYSLGLFSQEPVTQMFSLNYLI